jgi:hypothetical protein
MKKTFVLAFGLPALLAMLFIACTQPTNDDCCTWPTNDDGGKTGTDKAALTTAISNAENALATAAVNEAFNPSDVYEWVTAYISSSNKVACQATIDAAKTVSDNATTTQAEINTAVSNLTAAIAGKIKAGTKVGIIGAVGPAGGIIFYVDAADAYPGWKYLEAAPADLAGMYKWASTSYIAISISGTEAAIGKGRANTAAILARDADAPAAKACADYEYGGYSDWFLPSKDALNERYLNRASIGGFNTSDYFWTSSENRNDLAWAQTFFDGAPSEYGKNLTRFVRAVRAF